MTCTYIIGAFLLCVTLYLPNHFPVRTELDSESEGKEPTCAGKSRISGRHNRFVPANNRFETASNRLEPIVSAPGRQGVGTVPSVGWRPLESVQVGST